MSDRPDVYITDVSKSVVLEIRAGELVVSDQYPTMYTLRFPRVLRIRYDKNWDEAFNEGDLKDMVTNFHQTRRLKRRDNLEPNEEDVK
jgi:DNA ligase-4